MKTKIQNLLKTRVLSMLLALIMVVCMLPGNILSVRASATDTEAGTETTKGTSSSTTEEKQEKPVAEDNASDSDIDSSGTWGGIDWTLTSGGTLTISPADEEKITKTKPWSETTPKELYQVGEVPAAVNDAVSAITGWPFNRTAVKKLVIEEGVTSIGSFALQGLSNLTGEVVIPSTVTYIGQEAFQKSYMTKLTFAEGGTKELCIGPGAFKNLVITDLALPADRSEIHIHCWAFNDCTALTNVFFPANITTFSAWTHADYYGSDFEHVRGWDSQILARCTALKTLAFGSEEVKTLFYAASGNQSNINAIGGVANVIEPAAQIGGSYYSTLAEAIAAATAGQTIKFLADITEDVTISKAITIDGAGKTYTGKMTLKADTTIKNVNFDGKGYNGYAVETRGASNVTIEDCTAKNYGYGLLQLASGTALTTVKNVTVSNMNYGVKVDYSNAVVLENVDITANVAAVLNSNYGEKTITIKDSKLNILGTWTRNNTIKTNYVFEGANTIDSFSIDAAIDNFKLKAGATLTAPTGLTVTTDVTCGHVLYEDGKYYVFVGLLGSGTEADPYKISTAEDLIYFRDSVNAGETKYNAPGVYVVLTADIDLAGTDWSVNIGDDCNVTFDGIFDGKGYTIKNLTSAETAQKSDGYICTGLFGAIAGDAVVKNFTIENVTINTGDFTGNNVAAVVGFAYKATGSIENVTVKGNIQINANKVDGVGAIVGYAYGGKLTVKNCVVDGAAMTRSASAVNGQAYVGGIIGYAGGKITLSGNTIQNIAVNASSAAAGGVAGIILGGGVASANTVKNVTMTSAHANWQNAVGTVAGTFTGNITVSGTVAENNSTDAIVGVLHANKPTAPLGKAQAAVGDVYYGTFAEAYAAAIAGQTITLLADINMSNILVIDKAITLDGNGKTLTSTAARAINVSGANGVTIKNLTINCSGERAINIIQNATNVTIDNVTATAANYTVNVAGSAPNAVVAIKNSTLNGLNVVNVAAAGAQVTVDNSTVNCNDNNTTAGESYAALCLNKAAVGGSIIATNTIVNVTEGSDSEKGRNGAENGTVTINGSTEGVTVTVAVITYPGSDYYYGFTSLAAAIEFANAGDTITLIRDITVSEIITINKAITLDGNGKTLTSTAGRAINVSGADGVTIKNLTIIASGERAINIIQNATNVTIDNVTATAANYTVNVASSAPGAVVAIKDSILNGLCTVNVASAGANVTIDNSTINCNDNNTTAGESYAALGLNKDAVGAKITATNTTINVAAGSDSVKARNGAVGGEITIDGSTDGVATVVAIITYEGSDNYHAFYTLASAIEFAKAGDTITLIRDVAASETIIVNKSITLNLNGKNITGTDNSTGSFALITNKGDLTITGNGKITLTATNNRGWNAYSSVISNTVGGKLTVNGGIIEHLGGTDMAYAIDNLTNGKGTYAETVINGGTIKSTYRAIRQFLNGVEAQNILTINGGTIEGVNKAVWMQDPSKNANTGTLTIGAAAEIKGNVYLSVTEGSTEWPVNVSIAAEALKNGATVLTSNVPEGYIVEEKNGAWGVREANYVAQVGGVKYESLAAAINAATAGQTITFLADITEDVTISKAITIDGAGKTYTGAMTLKADTTIKNVNFDGKGYNGYAITTRGANYLTIEDCTAKNYGYGFVQLASGTALTTLKNVTVSNVNYGVKVDYSNAVVLENVDITAGVAAVLNSNYGEKTITIKNSKLNILGTWARNNTIKTNYVFEGANTINSFIIDAAIDTFKLTVGATLTAPNEITVTATEEGYSVKYKDGKYFVKANVAAIGEKTYTSLAEAIAAAKAGDTITFLADITGDVTVSKNVTIDGAGKTYTGKMTLTSNKGTVTIKNVNFDGKGYDGYAVVARGVYYITIEDCTAKNYGYGFVQLASSTVLTTVKNVTVSNMNYGVKIDYATEVVLENVDITANVAAVLNSNYGEKTVTIKNSTLNIISTWKRNDTTKTTYVFEGENTVGKFNTEAALDNFKLADESATLTAPTGLTVTTDVKYGHVLYEEGKYYVLVGLVGAGTESDPYQIGSVDDLIYFRNSVNAGETKYNAPGVYVALTADIDMADATWERGIGDGINATFDGIFDGNNKTIKNLNFAPEADADGYVCGGLFGYTYGAAVIKNLKLDNINVTTEDAGHNVGILVGFANNKGGALKVSGVTVTNSTIDAPNVYGVGAIVGYSYRTMGTIENCSVDNTSIKGYSFVGGITGYNDKGATISGCSVTNATITATSKGAGGIAGLVLGNTTVSNNTVANTAVTAATNWGYVIGEIAAEGVVVKNNTAADPQVGGVYSTGEKVQAMIGDKYYTTFAAALAAANDGETITLLTPVVVNAGETLTLDKIVTITYTSDVAGEDMITNRGTLIIDGATLIYNNTNTTGSNVTVSTISCEPGSVLEVNSGAVKNDSANNGSIGIYAYAIDLLTNGNLGDVTVTINGGEVISTNYMAIRQFNNGTACKNTLVVNSGYIYGAKRAIQIHMDNDAAYLAISGGKIEAGEGGYALCLYPKNSSNIAIRGGEFIGAVYSGTNSIISGGTFSEKPYTDYIVEGKAPYKNTDNSYSIVNSVASVNGVEYATLADALAAAKAGDTITFLADINENVTVSKNVTIDGNGKTYTGKMTLTSNKGTVTIKNVNFDGNGYNGYAVEARGVYYITIEACTAKNYGYGFVQLASGTVKTIVRNVTVSDMNYGIKIDYANEVVLENVDITAGVAAVLNSNYGEKTVTIKNSKLNILSTWKRNDTKKTTYVFEGNNTVGKFNTEAALDNFKLTVGTTLTAPEVANVTSCDDGYAVKYIDGKYVLVEKVVQNLTTDEYFDDLQEAIEKAETGETVVLLKNIDIKDVAVVKLDGKYNTYFKVVGKSITIDLNGKTISGAYDSSTILVGVFSTENNGHLTIKGNGTVNITSNGNVYCLIANYEPKCSITIENGTFTLDEATDSLIYSGCSVNEDETEGVVIIGGKFTLGNVGDGNNGKPWIFNTLGASERHIVVKGGTFNADINHQFWAHEVEVSETLALENNGNGTWTVVNAVVYVIEKDHNYERFVGYATLAEAIEAAKTTGGTIIAVKDLYIDCDIIDPVTILKTKYSVSYANGIKITAGTFDWDVTAKINSGDCCVKNNGNTYTVTKHNVVTDAAVAPTCTATGLTKGSHCDICGRKFVEQQVIDALGHKYEAVVTAPTFDSFGYTTHTCKNCGDSYKDSYENAIVAVAKIGETKYATLAEAINAAKAGDEIILLANVTEDVTVKKSITIDGADFKYTGNISVNGTTVSVTIRNIRFENGTGYAITTNSIKSITVENCTVTNYGYGFLYANKSTPTVVIRNVTVDDCNYGFHWVYGSNATLENVKMSGVENGIYVQNYASKTITIKDSNICSINIWERSGYSGVQTFKFEGKNTVGALSASQYAKYVLAAEGATLTAPAGANVTTSVQCRAVEYSGGIYKLVVAHTAVTDAAVAPKCTETGLTEGKHCLVCGEVLVAQETVAATGHNYTFKVDYVAPTCSNTGSYTVTGTCGCGYVITEVITIAQLAHIAVDDAAVAPTCTATGLTAGKHCSVCGEVIEAQTEIAAKGHTEVAIGTHVDATCTSIGVTAGKKCSVCNEVIEAQTVIAAKGHTWVEATLNAPKTCSVCGATEGTALTAVVVINGVKYTTLADAIKAAKAGDTITFLADITEDVTVEKDLTIDGANFKYTGNISVKGSTVDVIVKNVNFVNGTGYAITTNSIKSITVENCTVKNYGYGFLYANKSTPTVVVKNVTVDGGNYGFHYVYGSNATLENVTMTNVTYGLYIQNYASKTITLKNSSITSIAIWERSGYSGVQTFKFEGNNTVGTLSASQYAKYVLADKDATLTAPEGSTVTTTVEGSVVEYKNGMYVVSKLVVENGNTGAKYTTLAEAIAKATAGDTITFLADITEDVTVKKDLTIDGANFKYTGNISVKGSAVDVVIKNINFVDGTGYAITTNTVNSITVENCTVKNYGYGFLYANKSTPTVVVKNVTVDGGNYGFHYVYGSNATLENVTMTNVTYGLYIQNYAAKTINIKNCSITSIAIWERSGYSGVQTFKFEGNNTVGTLSTSEYAKYVLADKDATLKAPEGFTVTVNDKDYNVVYNHCTYVAVAKVYVAQIGETKFETLAEAIATAKDGDTIEILKDHVMNGSETVSVRYGYDALLYVDGKQITINFNGYTVEVTPDAVGGSNGLLEAVIFIDNDGELTLKGNGGFKVNAGTNLYSLIYNCGSTLTIESGSYIVEKTITSGSIIYAEDDQKTTIKNGLFVLGNAAQDASDTTKPWIFNTEGKNESFVIVNGGTFNQNILMNEGSAKDCEVDLKDGCCLYLYEGNGTWTVKAHTDVIDAAVAPDCTNTGLTEGSHCSNCGEVIVAQEVVDALGHTEVTDNAVAPTCTTTGLTEGKHCSVCNVVLVAQNTVDALGHNYVAGKVVAPTLDAQGYTVYECDRCDATENRDYTDKLTAVAEVNGDPYATLDEALAAAAQKGNTVVVLKDEVVVDTLAVPTGVILDLNGKKIVAKVAVLSYGVIIDSVTNSINDKAGEISVEENAIVHLQAKNEITGDDGKQRYMPLYDATNGCYKFFRYTIGTVITEKDKVEGSAKFNLRLTFNTLEAYNLLAAGNSKASIKITFTWAGNNLPLVFTFNQTSLEEMRNSAEDKGFGNVGVNMTLVEISEEIAETLTATYEFVSETGVAMSTSAKKVF